MTAQHLSQKWLYIFLIFQFACQCLLLITGAGPLRTLSRVAVFAPSLLMLVVPAVRRPHPDGWLIWVVVGLTSAGMLHPNLNSSSAGLGMIALTLSVWAPVLWVPRIQITPHTLLQATRLIWAFSFVSSVVGVLQVYFPALFALDPEFAKQVYGDAVNGLKITLDDGTTLFRPSGLSDSPGGASLAGMTVIVTGLAVAGTSRGVLRVLTMPASAVGLFCLLLCQVRSLLILTGLSVIGFFLLAFLSGRLSRAITVLLTVGVISAFAFGWAISVGSEVVTSRLESLGEGSAGEVYYRNRGIFLEDTIVNLVPEYPFGAGLGRWGMIYVYFGDPTNIAAHQIHAEIQSTAWVYDGGFLLLFAGYFAMFMLCWRSLYIAMTAKSLDMVELGAVICALNFGVIFTTFVAQVFVAQSGLQFCMLNAALFTAARFRTTGQT